MAERFPVPTELGYLRDATRFYLNMVRDLEPMVEQVADVNARIEPRWRELRDHLKDAQLNGCIGSPAAIGRVIAELLGER